RGFTTEAQRTQRNEKIINVFIFNYLFVFSVPLWFIKCNLTRLSASLVVRLWISARVPNQLYDIDRTPPSHARAAYTSPTGLSAIAPPGPASPTVLTAKSVPSLVRPPTAIAS